MDTVHRVGRRAGLLACGVALLLSPALRATADERPPRAEAEAAAVELGRRLFFEPLTSISGLRACSTCHDPDHGFSSPARLDREEAGFAFRHTQSVVDLFDRRGLHWDGELEDVEELVRKRIHGWFWGQRVGPLLPVSPSDPQAARHGRELEALIRTPAPGQGLSGVALALRVGGLGTFPYSDPAANLEAAQRYAEAFGAVHGSTSATVERIGAALTAYLRSLRSTRSPLDRHLAGEPDALSPAAARGLELFRGRARCARCHLLEGADGRAPLTDRKFHDTGVAWIGEQARRTAGLSDVLLFMDGTTPSFVKPERAEDRGRGYVTGGAEGERAFKTPSLRDVARRGPFMHDGSLATLEDVVRHYATGAGEDPKRDERVRGFEATEAERADLVAFLRSLRGETRPGLATGLWARRARETRLVFVDGRGRPLAGLPVTLLPAGDPLPSPGPPDAPLVRTTDARGRLAFAPFASTHARLVLQDDLLPVGGPLVPDTCASAEVVLPVSGRGSIAVRFAPGRPAPSSLSGAHLLPEVAERWPKGAERTSFGGLVVDHRSTFARTGLTRVAGQDVAVYEGWVRTDLGPSTLLLLPGETLPRFVTLVAGATVDVDATRPSAP